ncbi:hypothetical protein SEE436_022940 [Salmonella enterica subsp. enterica serovar Enteritidis str. 436]|nr:hypothetical protein SEE436_022940 [Salmonella enterica subsp. enterica serovar Enteritidis str. 436]
MAAKLNCAPDVHAIKEALALALPSVQSQMENLAVDMGYTPGVLALFYKVAMNTLPFPEFRPLNWVYPRWRGEHSCAIKIRLSHAGLSPLARGTLIIDDNSTDRQQFIPAGAGNTIIGNLSWTGTAVYPRWRGEHESGGQQRGEILSLSPLARGTH